MARRGSRSKLLEGKKLSHSGSDDLLDCEGSLPSVVSSSYVGMGCGDISLSQYKIARSARKRWLRSDGIRSIGDMGALIRIVLYDNRLSMYLVSDRVEDSSGIYSESSVLLASGSIEEWFRRSFESEVGIRMEYCSVLVSRRYFNFHKTLRSLNGYVKSK